MQKLLQHILSDKDVSNTRERPSKRVEWFGF